MDPAHGKFISEDPAGFIDGPNMYQYALSDPFNGIDPTGLATSRGNNSGSNSSYFGSPNLSFNVDFSSGAGFNTGFDLWSGFGSNTNAGSSNTNVGTGAAINQSKSSPQPESSGADEWTISDYAVRTGSLIFEKFSRPAGWLLNTTADFVGNTNRLVADKFARPLAWANDKLGDPAEDLATAVAIASDPQLSASDRLAIAGAGGLGAGQGVLDIGNSFTDVLDAYARSVAFSADPANTGNIFVDTHQRISRIPRYEGQEWVEQQVATQSVFQGGQWSENILVDSSVYNREATKAVGGTGAQFLAGAWLNGLLWGRTPANTSGVLLNTADDVPTQQVGRTIAQAGEGTVLAPNTKVWGPGRGVGPLGEDVAKTFRGGRYVESIVNEPTTLYRVYGGKAGQLSPYWTRTKPAGPLQSRLDSAVLSEWGNTADNVVSIRVPKGTTIFEGAAAPQVGKDLPFESVIGGGSQVYIPRVNPDWIVSP